MKTIITSLLAFTFSLSTFAYSDLESLAEQVLDGKFGPRSLYRPADNAEGLIAWGESHRLKGYLSMYEATRDEQYLRRFKDLADYLLSRRDHLLNKKDVLRKRVVNGWGSTRYTSGRWHNFAVHNAVVVEQLARFSQMVSRNDDLKKTGLTYLKESKKIINEFEEDWKETRNFSFYYFIPGAHHSHHWQPWNQGLGMGLAMLEIVRAERAYGLAETNEYLDRIKIMGKQFKDVLKLNSRTNAYSWEYSALVGLEDFGHALIDLKFAYEMYQERLIFDRTDMVRFANAYLKHMRRSNGTHAAYVDGRNLGKPDALDVFCSQLLYLGQFDRRVYSSCVSSNLKDQLNARSLSRHTNGLIFQFVSGIPELIRWK